MYATEKIFLQFEEQHLVAGDVEDAPNGVSWTLSWFGVDEVTMPALETVPGQDRDQLIAAIVQTVEGQWEGVDVEFVTERPASGDFIMVTMGGSGDLINLGYAGGWGIVDCYDENKTPVAFVFSERLANDEGLHDVNKLAMVVSQEAAHTVGLEHLGGDESFIMYPSSSGGIEHHFSTQCEDITNPIEDPDHPEYCLDHPGCPMGEQNDIAHLVEYIGPAVPDGDPGDDTDTGDDGGTTDGGDPTGTDDGDGTTEGGGDGGGSDDGDGEDPEPDDGGTDDDSEGSGGGDADEGETVATRGCSCTTAPAGPAWPLALLGIPLVALRRRARP